MHHSTSTKRKLVFRDYDNSPRLNPDFSKLLRNGELSKFSTEYEIALEAGGEWAASNCICCERIVATAILDDGDQYHAEIGLRRDGTLVAILTQPHLCEQMIRHERAVMSIEAEAEM